MRFRGGPQWLATPPFALNWGRWINDNHYLGLFIRFPNVTLGGKKYPRSWGSAMIYEPVKAAVPPLAPK